MIATVLIWNIELLIWYVLNNKIKFSDVTENVFRSRKGLRQNKEHSAHD